MQKRLVVLLSAGLLLLAACGGEDPELADSAQDIAGSWQRNNYGTALHFNEDGTFQAVNSAWHVEGEFWFEGTQLFLTSEIGSYCPNRGFDTGIYEIQMLSSGGLRFVPIEDGCRDRRFDLADRDDKAWQPLPS